MPSLARIPPLFIGLLVSAAPLAAQARCEVRRELEGNLDTARIRGVLVEAGAGSLDVVGTDGSGVRVRGVVCASDETLADAARLVVEPRRDAAWIETTLPDVHGRAYVRMDLVVEMPRELAADIRDGSGGLQVRSVAAVRIDDGSGELAVEDVEGAVEIEDNSGEIRVRNVGSVQVRDGSGEIEIEEVHGDVHVLDDGSGSIDIRSVEGDVLIDEDGSGSIVVEGVGGDFLLGRDGSGSVRYRDVRGTVRVPEHR